MIAKDITFTLRAGEEYIPLIQLLKATGCAETGAEAQALVASGQVRRNGSVERRKRAKLVAGDVIECGARTVAVAR